MKVEFAQLPMDQSLKLLRCSADACWIFDNSGKVLAGDIFDDSSLNDKGCSILKALFGHQEFSDLITPERINRGITFKHQQVKLSDGRNLLLSGAPVTLPSIPNSAYLVSAVILPTGAFEKEKTTYAEESLEILPQKTDGHLEVALEAGSLGTWVWDITADIVRVDTRYKELWDIDTPGDIVPVALIMSRIHPEDRSLIIIQEILEATPPPSAMEFRVVHRNGDVRWLRAFLKPVFDSAGTLQRFVGVNIDITKQKLVHLELEAALAKFNSIFNQMADGVILVDTDGNFVDMNPAAFRIHGFPSGEEMKQALSQLGESWEAQDLDGEQVPPDQWPIARALRGEEVRDLALYVIRKSNGHYFCGSYSGGPIRDANGKIILGAVTIRDITDQKEKEFADELRHSTQRIAYEVARVGTFEWDIVNNVNKWSPELEALYGLSPGTFDGDIDGWRRRVFTEDLDAAYAEIERSFQTGHFETEFRVVHPDGSVHWLAARAIVVKDKHGKPIKMLGANLDIDRQKAAESAVRESESRFRIMADGLPLIVWVHGPDGRQQFVNKTFREYYGITETDVEEGIWQILLHPEDSEHYISSFFRSVQDQSEFREEVRVKNSQGAWRHLEAWGLPRFGSDGAYLGHVGTCLDITDRKIKEQELHKLTEELITAKESAEKLSEAKGRFLSHISHELRTPLTAILAYAQLMVNSTDPVLQECVVGIRDSSNFMLEMINDLLDLAKIDSGRFVTRKELVDLVQCITEVRDLLLLRARSKGLFFKLQWEGRLPKSIMTDALRLRQILVNLTANAIKFTNEGGVTISIRNPFDSVIEIDVIDTGVGISEVHQKHLFGAFFQASEHHGGTGLGLTISKRLAEQLGGDITVQSKEGKGSTFRVKIDCGCLEGIEHFDGSGVTAIDKPERTNAICTDLSGLHILVVDDNVWIREVARKMLETVGAAVSVVGRGEDAVKVLKEVQVSPKRQQIDALVLDLNLPDMDGFEVISCIRSMGLKTPCVAVTADLKAESEIRAFESGCNAWLPKPFELADLAATIANLTRQASN